MAPRNIIYLVISLIIISSSVFADDEDRASLYVFRGHSLNSYLISRIDSITFNENSPFVRLWCNEECNDLLADSMLLGESSDMVIVHYAGDTAYIENRCADEVKCMVHGADVDIRSSALRPMKYVLDGKSKNGSFACYNDTLCHIVLNGVNLKSVGKPAINTCKKQNVNIVIAADTQNSLEDSDTLYLRPDNATTNGCLHFEGKTNISGGGELNIKGNNKHALFCNKGLTIDGGKINAVGSVGDAFHSNKSIKVNGGSVHVLYTGQDGFDAEDGHIAITGGSVDITIDQNKAKAINCDSVFTMDGGCLNMSLKGKAAKGIKCGDAILSGGVIIGNASGNLIDKDGDLSYSALIKTEGDLSINGGSFTLSHYGDGGKCISVGKNLNIDGGSFHLFTSGAGGEYINTLGETDYFTPKCIAADEKITIIRGDITCKCTGLGGKGIISHDVITFGNINQKDTHELTIDIETEGESVVNDSIYDIRYGTPKAIKSNSFIYVYSGDFNLKTHGMGGEGIEAYALKIKGGNITCNTFDDGINVERSLDLYDGKLYCNSINNDGIDSNGQIKINGGEVFSVSQHFLNEPFDSEGEALYIKGGKILGLSRQSVDIRHSTQPVHNDGIYDRFPVVKGMEYSVVDSDGVILYSFISPYDDELCRLIVSLPEFDEGQAYKLVDSNGKTINNINPITK